MVREVSCAELGRASPPPVDPPRRSIRVLYLMLFAGMCAGFFLQSQGAL
jgi:hypothetical protein